MSDNNLNTLLSLFCLGTMLGDDIHVQRTREQEIITCELCGGKDKRQNSLPLGPNQYACGKCSGRE